MLRLINPDLASAGKCDLGDGHELGHTFGLRHCEDWRCVMTSSHAVERLDVKESEFCPRCRKAVTKESYW